MTDKQEQDTAGKTRPSEFFGDLLAALSRLAGNRQKDGVSSLVSREDRETIINGCHDLMIVARQGPTITDEMVERAARAMCEAWHYAPIGTPDGNAEWHRKQDQYRKQARAVLLAAGLSTTS